jgi:hypothetical protein
MMKPIFIATMALVAPAMPVFAQGGNAPSAPPPRAALPTIVGQTGRMYDGNNANLQVPPEQNAYWPRLWAQPLGGARTGGQR